LLQHVVDAATAVEALEEVVVVLGAKADAVAAATDLRGSRVVHCADWDTGMSASLRAGVAALAPGTDTAVVLLADQPRITAPVVALVAAAAAVGDAEAVRATYAGIPGHPVALGRALLAQVPALRGDAGARDLLRHAAVGLVEAGHLGDPADVDTLHDLTRLEATLR